MNIDANVQRIIALLVRKWKILFLFALIGAILAGVYTANFTTLTYSSSVEFLAYTQDTQQELADSTTTAQQASNTSKMNYALKMLDTYIELFKTNEFNQTIANDLNNKYKTSYTAGQIKGALTFQTVENTAMFKIIVTTTDADMSYQIAHQLETSIPNKMEQTNSGLVNASVEDSALKATTSESRGYTKKMAIGFIAGAVLAAAYVILRDFLDIRVKSSDELTERYNIPVLGTIPEFEPKSNAKASSKSSKKTRRDN